MQKQLLEKAHGVGLTEDKYRFVFGPEGFEINGDDMNELTRLGKASVHFVANADRWYRSCPKGKGAHIVSILQSGIPKKYLPFGFRDGLPQTLMVDTVWTKKGWRIVEIDVTNRNGLGFPLVMRHLYGLPNIWKGTDRSWREAGFTGTTQVMGHYCRFYEPYYRMFLQALNGSLIKEQELGERMSELEMAPSLVDLPVFHKGEHIDRMIGIAERIPVGIPPKHHLSSKALVGLGSETSDFSVDGAGEFLPDTRLLWKNTEAPDGNFFVKLLQSGGAHGTFHNDHAKLQELRARRPQAILQKAWDIAKRPISILSGDTREKVEKFIRFSLYVDPQGVIVDADVTASDEPIVHGGSRSIMTVPVLV